MPMILLSGGMDSEVVVKSFIDAGLTFEVFTFEYPDELNAHETYFVNKFCTRHGLKPNFFKIDIRKFAYTEEAEKLFLESQSHHFEFVPHMHLMNHIWSIGGAPVTGNHEPHYERFGREWRYVEYEWDMALYKHARRNNIGGSMGFFQHTPEQMLAMMLHPRFVKLTSGADPAANVCLKTSAQVKYQLYLDTWPDLVLRKKQTGAERVGPLMNRRSMEMVQKRGTSFNQVWTELPTRMIELLQPHVPTDAGG